MPYVYDQEAIFPRKIHFAFAIECVVAWTRYGGVPIMGYRFVDESRKTVYDCPAGHEAGERAVRFAKLQNRFCPYEDQFDWAHLHWEKLCEEQGIEFESASEMREWYREFCQYYKEKTGKDWTLLGKSEAYKSMMLTAPGRR